MPQGTDEAGNVWELDAQGNPVRFISHGQQAIAPNQMKVQGAQLDNQNAQATLQQKQATMPYDVRSAQAGAFNAEKAPEYKQYDNTLKLRSDFDAMPTVKEYRVGIAQLAQGLKTQADATGDNALIYAYAKAMDPGSVVRESEMGMASSGASVFDSVTANLKKQFNVEGGGQLAPQLRDRLRREIINKVTQMSEGYDAQRNRYIEDAKAFGIDPDRVVGQHDALPYLPALQEYDRSRQGNAMTQDTTGVGDTPLAGGSGDRKTIPPPPAMQAEYEGYVAANRGRLDPQAYAQFRAELQDKYGFGNPGIQPQYVEEASRINDDVAKGRRLNLRLPGVDAAKTGFDKVKGYGLNNPVGAAVTGALSLGGGLDELSGGLSAITGGDYTLARDQANAARQSLAGQYPGETIGGTMAGSIGMGYGAGRAFPALSGLVNSGRGAAATGAGYGAVSGALENNDNRFMGGVVGAGAGATGGALGAKVIGPGLERLARTNAGQSIAEIASALRGKITRNAPQFQRAPQYTPDEAAVQGIGGDITAMRGNIQDAADLNLPYALADADPKLQALAGAVTRKSINARALAENTFDPRGRGQAGRAGDLIDTHLAPYTDIEQRSADLIQAGNQSSAPFYNLARQRAAPVDDQIGAMLETPAGKQALANARELAGNEGRDPLGMGFDLDEQGEVILRNMPTFETLQYVKRGLDQVVEGHRNPMGQLDLQGNPMAQAVNGLRGRFNARLGELDENYARGNAEYAGFAQRRDALKMGYEKLPNNAIPLRQFEGATGRMSAEQLPEAQRGYATAMADNINRVNLSRNPFEAVYGAPVQQQKVAGLFPEGSGRFARAYELEQQMAKTRNETLGGSPTAGRQQADGQIGNNMLEHGANAAGTVATGGWGIGTAARAMIDAGRIGIGKAGERNADKIAPVLFNTENPAELLQYIDKLSLKKATIEARKKAYGKNVGLFGAIAAPAMLGS